MGVFFGLCVAGFLIALGLECAAAKIASAINQLKINVVVNNGGTE